ncbi:MAG TPA: hypothetical protein VF630_14955 [Hymenobacter sp.]|jgi:hypothetical protein
MNLFRTLGVASLACLACLVGTGLNGCINAPEYDTTPEIEFKELQVVHVPRSGGLLGQDTLKFFVNFKDGDGDLGLSDEDIKVAPFNSTTGGINGRGNGFNYFIQPYKKKGPNGPFEKFVVSNPGEYDGRFLRLDDVDGGESKPAPLRGILQYKLPLFIDGNSQFPGVFNEGDVFRFEISISDRSLHQSNTVTTSEVTLGG